MEQYLHYSHFNFRLPVLVNIAANIGNYLL